MSRLSKQALLRSCMICVALPASGCSSPRLFDHAFLTTYKGFTEVTPKIASSVDDPDFPFIPGSLVVAWQDTTDAGVLKAWNANTDLRCQSGAILGNSGAWRRTSYSVRPRKSATKSFNSSKLVKAFALEDVAGFAIQHLDVSITNVRSYQPDNRQLLKLSATAMKGCPVLPGAHIVKAVIVGDIKISASFKTGIDLLLKADVMNRIKIQLGAQYAYQRDNELEGKQIAFGVKLQAPN